MQKYSKHARQNRKVEITNQFREICIKEEIEYEVECEYESYLMRQKLDNLFDERFEYPSNPWF